MPTSQQIAEELLRSCSLGDALRAVTIAVADTAQCRVLDKSSEIEALEAKALAVGLQQLHRELFPAALVCDL